MGIGLSHQILELKETLEITYYNSPVQASWYVHVNLIEVSLPLGLGSFQRMRFLPHRKPWLKALACPTATMLLDRNQLPSSASNH